MDIHVRQGFALVLDVVFETAPGGVAINLVGSKVALVTSPYTSVTPVVVDAANGLIRFRLSPSQTASIAARVYAAVVSLHTPTETWEFPFRLIVTPYEYRIPIPDDNGHDGDHGYSVCRDRRIHVVGGDKSLVGPQGDPGAPGTDGWSPQFELVPDGDRVVMYLDSWTGGTGSPPPSGLYMGSGGYVVSIGDAVDLRGPPGEGASTFAFGTVVAGATSLVADAPGDTLTVVAGTGISVTGNAGTDTMTVSNTGVTSVNGSSGDVSTPNAFSTVNANGTSLVADSYAGTLNVLPGTGIGVTGNAGTDTLTVTNTGVTSVNGSTGAVTTPFTFGTVNANGVNLVADSTSDTLAILPGDGIAVSGNSGTDTLTITNTGVKTVNGAAGDVTTPNYFQTVRANGVDLVADSLTDVLTMTPGTGIGMTANAGTDSVVISNTGVTSVNGSAGAVTTPFTFGTVNVNGTNLVADSTSDTLNVLPGTGISMSANAGTDTFTVSNAGVTSFNGNTGIVNYLPAYISVLSSTTTTTSNAYYDFTGETVTVLPGKRVEVTFQANMYLVDGSSDVIAALSTYSSGTATGLNTGLICFWGDAIIGLTMASPTSIGYNQQLVSNGTTLRREECTAKNVPRETYFSIKVRGVIYNTHADKTIYCIPSVRTVTNGLTTRIWQGSSVVVVAPAGV